MLNGLTVLSLVMCAGTIALCVGSLIAPLNLSRWYGDGRGMATLTAERGAVRFSGYDQSPNVGGSYGATTVHSWAGVRVRQTLRARPTNRHVEVSIALPFIMACVLPVPMLWGLLWGWRTFHARRRPWGLCPACDYDLTGNVSGVCPECGMKIAEAK
jgi:hypothetical protein